MNLPRYWRDEVGTGLQPALWKFFEGQCLSPEDVALIRAYLMQWISSPVWKGEVRERRATARAEKLEAELRRQRGIEKRRATMAAKREAAATKELARKNREIEKLKQQLRAAQARRELL